MVSLRRSVNNNNNNSTSNNASSVPYPTVVNSSAGSSVNPLGRPSEKVAPPQKVIKALRSHRSTNPSELSYTAGDFWYVTGERDGWYEALNPLVGSRGLVPRDDFEEFSKGGRTVSSGGVSRSTNASRSHTPSLEQNARSPPFTSPPTANPQQPQNPPKNRPPVYAVVMYDFTAERPDELNVSKGESLVIIAQSNHEWFVAKPIGRLGGPGLIPVAFVEIRDLATGKSLEVLPDTIPMVEEWKKATAEYKAAAIPLGRFDMGDAPPVQNSPYAAQAPAQQPQASSSSTHTSGSGRRPLYRPEQDSLLPPGDFISLSVPSFHKESGNYWFRLQVTFVPDDPSGPGYSLTLYRTYEDFYDFQISLLDTFPHEAGRPRNNAEEEEVPERILPYMPGPVEDEIDDELTEYRREELDLYVKALVDLRSRGAGYVTRHELFRSFYAARYGDYCEETPRDNFVAEVEERLADVSLHEDRSSSQRYGQDRSASAASRHSQPSSQMSGGHGRQNSSSRNSPLPPAVDASASRPSSSSQGHYISGGPSTGISSATSWSAPQMSATTPGANGVPNLPGGQPPYVKIKVYDRSTDDLIALRVHPNVSHADLFEKVRARLGPEINILRYRTSMTGPQGGAYREIMNDSELRSWMRAEDQKLVLYAEQ